MSEASFAQMLFDVSSPRRGARRWTEHDDGLGWFGFEVWSSGDCDRQVQCSGLRAGLYREGREDYSFMRSPTSGPVRFSGARAQGPKPWQRIVMVEGKVTMPVAKIFKSRTAATLPRVGRGVYFYSRKEISDWYRDHASNSNEIRQSLRAGVWELAVNQ